MIQDAHGRVSTCRATGGGAARPARFAARRCLCPLIKGSMFERIHDYFARLMFLTRKAEMPASASKSRS